MEIKFLPMKKKLLNILKEADPKDSQGYVSLLEFNHRQLLAKAMKMVNEKKFKEAITWLNKKLERSNLPKEQEQWIHSGIGTVYRRWKGHERQAKKAFNTAWEIDQNSIAGKASRRMADKFYGKKK